MINSFVSYAKPTSSNTSFLLTYPVLDLSQVRSFYYFAAVTVFDDMFQGFRQSQAYAKITHCRYDLIRQDT